MAELENSCCTPAAQATCCEPPEKAECCGDSHIDGCGCAAGDANTEAATGVDEVRETVRQRYAEAAHAVGSGCGCSESGVVLTNARGEEVFGGALYDEQAADAGTAAAVEASLGCGVPTAVADLHDGETVLDLGSGAGADVLISARRVAPTGRAIGLDMTDEMLDLARANARTAGVENVEFVKGYLEDMPLADGSVDVIISNCVINLSGDKAQTIAEAARVLRPGGRFAVSDVIADPEMDDETKADMAAWTGCIAGALTEHEFRTALATAGFEEIEITPSHRVHEHAAAAIIRARKPTADRSVTHPLRMAIPECRLDDAAIEDQVGRFRQLAGHVSGIERGAGEIRVQFDERVPDGLLALTLAVEQRCCNFIGLDYRSESRSLRITVADPSDDAKLDSFASLLAPA